MLPFRPFYMIRHGQTIANAANVAAGGQFDTPLTEKGVEQARKLAKAIGQLEVKPQVIYHSNMQRARDTATYLNESLDLAMHEREDLREQDMGEWEGEPWNEVLPRLESNQFPEQGETSTQFAARIQNALTDIITNHNNNLAPPMIVAHGGLFFALGFLYEYGISPVQNCHLHYFDPHPANTLFPWKVRQFDIDGDSLSGSPAVFCDPNLRDAS